MALKFLENIKNIPFDAVFAALGPGKSLLLACMLSLMVYLYFFVSFQVQYSFFRQTMNSHVEHVAKTEVGSLKSSLGM